MRKKRERERDQFQIWYRKVKDNPEISYHATKRDKLKSTKLYQKDSGNKVRWLFPLSKDQTI